MDVGQYTRVGELGPNGVLIQQGDDNNESAMATMAETQAETSLDVTAAAQAFTYRETASGRRSLAKAEKLNLLGSAAALQVARKLSFPDGFDSSSQGAGYTKRGTGRNELGLDRGGSSFVAKGSSNGSESAGRSKL